MAADVTAVHSHEKPSSHTSPSTTPSLASKDHWSLMATLADVLPPVQSPDETLATAQLYYNRYVRFISTTSTPNPLDAPTLALTTLILSTKATESPRRLHTVLIPAHRLLNPTAPPLRIPSATYDALRATLVRAELLLLRVLKFELRHPLALEYIPRYLERTIGEVDGADEINDMRREEREEWGVVAPMETGIGKACRAEVVAAYKNYQLANFFPARAIAAACVFRTIQSRGLHVADDVGAWVDDITSRKVDEEDLNEILLELNRNT
ncbi:MAG: hypothetical protein M1833_006670 [Piccolia ochrophora]|nr:MAG: hypothetical protein M1833_006670 [Piccolia ochrophora]